jgi:hypothetical protein
VKRAVLAGAMILTLAAGAGAGGAAAAPKPRPAGIDWGAGHFTAPEAWKTWLADRGVRYEDWRQRHPRGAYLMTHPAPARRTPDAPLLGGVSQARTSGLSGAAILAIYGLAVALLLLAAVPGRLLVGVIPIEHHARLTPARTTFAAIGLSLLVGATVASLL